jgi:hypothetical protein
MWNPDIQIQLAAEHGRELLAAHQHAHLVAQMRGTHPALRRRAAGLAGHLLLQAGTLLVRYGRAEGCAPMQAQRPSA